MHIKQFFTSQVKFESKFVTYQYIPNIEEDFGEEGDPIVVWGDDDDVDTRWFGFVTSIDSTNAAVATLDESCLLLMGLFILSAVSLVPS